MLHVVAILFFSGLLVTLSGALVATLASAAPAIAGALRMAPAPVRAPVMQPSRVRLVARTRRGDVRLPLRAAA